MKPFLKYGLWTGAISGLWGIGCFTIVGWLNTALFHQRIPATQIRSYLGMKQAKLKGGNTLTYGQAIQTGILIACVTAVVVACFSWLYCMIINPGYADFMVKDTERVLVAAGKSPQEISQQLDAVRKEFSAGAQVGMAVVGQAVVGTIAALILGLFIRTKKTM